jgi:hypothetical protein
MDGAILVVSAADGPMPQSDPDAETLSINVEWAGVDSEGTVRFEGIATTSAGGKTSPPFDITGTARTSAAPGDPPPTYIVWDIVGGNVPKRPHSKPAFSVRNLMRIWSPYSGVPDDE